MKRAFRKYEHLKLKFCLNVPLNGPESNDEQKRKEGKEGEKKKRAFLCVYIVDF